MPEASLIISNQKGLHARAAAKLVQCAAQFDAHITVSKDGETVSAASIMGLLMLAARQGTSVTICTEGVEADAALDALAELVNDKFGED